MTDPLLRQREILKLIHADKADTLIGQCFKVDP